MENITDFELRRKSELAAAAGGSYFNPVQELLNSGRELKVSGIPFPDQINFITADNPTYFISKFFNILISQVHESESLFGVYYRGKYTFAPYLANRIWLTIYEAQVQVGDLQRVGFYAISNDIADRGVAETFPLG